MTNDLQVQVRKESSYAVISTDGYINNVGGEKVGEIALGLVDEGYKNLILNLEKSNVVNSIGVSILIELVERIQDIEGRLYFCNLTKVIAKTFTIMGLAEVAGIVDTEAEAIAALAAPLEA